MNTRRVLHILGQLLFILAGAQLVPLVWCLEAGGAAAAPGLAIGAAASAGIGLACRRLGSTTGELYRREGVLIVVGAWLFASLTGAIPYVVSGAIPSVIDALFESASGFTTTGASILVDIEAVGRPLLFWRSFTQWLGGIGIVVLFVALLSELGPGARFLFKLEVPGPKAEILHARVQETALALFRIYVALTLVEVVLLLVLGVGVYDALTHSFSTLSTGGFSPHSDSIAGFGASVKLVVMLFMIAAGVNFSLYYTLLRRRDLIALRDIELRVYAAIVVSAAAIVAFDLALAGTGGADTAVLDAAFQVVSILTTTGFSTADFSQWPSLAVAVLVGLMLVGGCAGSTAGGVKIVRLLIAWKAALREVRLTFSPNAVIAVAVGRGTVPEDSVRGVVGLLILWVTAWGFGAILLAVGDVDILTAATASIATLSNIGPGLAGVGPTENFAFFAPWQKLVMVGLMWLGRLEFFALLSIFQPQFWRR
ncbi:MAG: TrkH family potassium uptake protein [Deltaproteobacteria bacterium]|nr:TrkH family potassium uptake protein [Deltaproteobacteria bacterium]